MVEVHDAGLVGPSVAVNVADWLPRMRSLWRVSGGGR